MKTVQVATRKVVINSDGETISSTPWENMKIAKLNSRNRQSKPLVPPPPPPVAIKLDLGCGPNKRPGFTGADQIAFPGVDVVIDLVRRKRVITEVHPLTNKPVPGMVGDFMPWIWDDNSVEEAHCSHFLEHLDATERMHFINELYRVMKPGAKCTLICPHWSSCRAYGDPTHKWPPISEFAFYYWKKDWRMVNAPHTDTSNLNDGFNCNFEVTWGYSLEPGVAARNQEYQQMAMTYYKEACQDVIATLLKC